MKLLQLLQLIANQGLQPPCMHGMASLVKLSLTLDHPGFLKRKQNFCSARCTACQGLKTLNKQISPPPRPLMNKSREVRESRAFGELWNTDVRTTSEQFYFDELCEYLTLRCFAAVYSFPQSSPHCIPLNSSILPDSVWPYSRIQFGHGA